MSGTGGRTSGDGTSDAGRRPRSSRPTAKASRKAPTAVELRATLADRERQLRDLTEQSLDLLDRLAEAQRHEAELREVAGRADELARQLDDARRRIRTAGGAVLRGGTDEHAGAVEIVLWGGDEASVRARLATLGPADAGPGATGVSWVGHASTMPTWAGDDDRVQWLAGEDARTPAQCWNLAMAATRADLVLFLGPTARPAGAPAIPDLADDPSVALAQPVCARGDAKHLGRRDHRNLTDLAPIVVDPTSTDPTDVPFADPAAFLVRRRAFETVGMFDEGLLSDLALADYALRAQARGFRTLGLPTARIELGPAATDDAVTRCRDVARDRLLLLASHRPTALGGALAEEETLWQLEPGAVVPFVTDLFARLPDGESAKARAAILGSMVASAAPATKVIAALHELLATQVRVWITPPLPEAADELAALVARVDAAPPGSIDEALAALDAVLAFERRWMPQLAGDLIDAARRQAQTTAHGQQLASQLEATRAEVRLHLEGLQLVAQAIDMVGHVEPARIRERLIDLRRDAEHLAGLLAAAGAPSPTALIEELYEIRTQLASGRDAMADRDRELVAHRRELAERDRELAERDRELAERDRELEARERDLAERDSKLAEYETELAARERELRALTGRLGERSRWVAALLAEVGKRRLRPRKLLDHERAFLAEQERTN